MFAPEDEKQFRQSFGLRLREAIKRKFAYHKDFREVAGLADGTLKNWLNGSFMPGVYDLRRLSTVLEVDMLWLGYGVGEAEGQAESFRDLLARHTDIVARVFSEVRDFAQEKGLSDETAAKMLIDYLDNELHLSEDEQRKVG